MPEPANIVIFGASGDLSKRKLMPALARMYRSKLMHPDSHIIGVVKDLNEEEWRQMVRDSLEEFAPETIETSDDWKEFDSKLAMVTGDLGDDEPYKQLSKAIIPLHDKKNVMFYLAIPPMWYSPVAHHLGKLKLDNEDDGFRRIVIEKPFGMDYDSAHKLNEDLWEVFNESQIYRIDHYLGKESVQNLLVFRFANSILEPLWNRNYIDHVQIFASETLGIEYRANYYEKSGALRDMIQSHLMQVMTLVAMEPPTDFTADDVRDEKVKVLRAIKPINKDEIDKLSLGFQYGAGKNDDEKLPAYCTEQGVSADSTTETFAAVRFQIDNWRWQGVPFIIWTGKRMKKRASEIMIRFKKPPHNIFDASGSSPKANALVFRLQPDEGMVFRMNAKLPGLTTDIQRLVMRAPYSAGTGRNYEAYEVLMQDVLQGDATLFSRADEVEESWKLVEPIINSWKDRLSIKRYRAGTWDVPEIDQLLDGCVGGWHKPT
ncbi:MAG: glucose-6-phosphate dehydrogenase [Methylococcales bacterium]|nr:glucose-6-phosphate dehydrogenase [Methylococcales bacterium]